jgi:hypothetical protein
VPYFVLNISLISNLQQILIREDFEVYIQRIKEAYPKED